ncbi:MAG: ASKHA domain-containing protein [Deltaproteobacteria bacterium]|jgi:uncharacterized 2Fe-2S/4Fe-4S cluster protein (DUF4445 family)|nr:ASKHA domain-containing protein [Deltaproteobacteria bacterium]
MPRVRFFPDNGAVVVRPGLSLLEAARAAGVDLVTPCGGNGVCGKCLLRVLSGSPDADPAKTATDAPPGPLALACRHLVGKTDLDLEIPRNAEEIMQIHDQGQTVGFDLAPRLAKRFQTAPGRTEVLAGGRHLCFEEGNTSEALFGLAVDIGTTTLAVSLVDLRTGRETASAASLNTQSRRAQDVLGRVSFAAEPGGLAALQKDVLGDLNELIAEVCRQAGLDRARIYEAVICGNTCMLHLVAGKDPAALGRRPFLPDFRGHAYVRAADLGLNLARQGEVYFPPVMSGYIGADITAGIVATGLEQCRRPTLFIDIGTNGEMALAKEGRLIAASTAAGPAFEGMNISSGMRASAGAIESFQLRKDGKICWKTIGGLPPRGVCGSGLIDAVAELAVNGLLAPSGRFSADGGAFGHALERVEGKSRFQLAPGVFLTQKDIRQVQLAKAAIRAGIDILLAQAGFLPAEVERVLVAGSFGYHLRERSLLNLGLLPAAFAGKTEFVGNTSKAGARIFLLDAARRAASASLAEGMRCLELAELPEFQDIFTSSMSFPARDEPPPENHPRKGAPVAEQAAGEP